MVQNTKMENLAGWSVLILFVVMIASIITFGQFSKQETLKESLSIEPGTSYQLVGERQPGERDLTAYYEEKRKDEYAWTDTFYLDTYLGANKFYRVKKADKVYLVEVHSSKNLAVATYDVTNGEENVIKNQHVKLYNQ